MISPEVRRISEAHRDLEGKFDLKYRYNFKRNTLPIEERLRISLEGLSPSHDVVQEWANATKRTDTWVEKLSPDAIILSGRSSEVTMRSLMTVDAASLYLPFITFNAAENEILYQDDVTRLMTDEDFYEDYLVKGKQYQESYQKRRNLLTKKLEKENKLPQCVVVLDEMIRMGYKAFYLTKWLEEQEIDHVHFGALVGPVETSLVELGSENINLYAFLGNFSQAIIALQSFNNSSDSDISHISALVDESFTQLQAAV